MTQRDCARCGAVLSTDGACPWCGAPAAPPPPPPAAPAAPRPEPTVPERLRALRASAAWTRLADTSRTADALDRIRPRPPVGAPLFMLLVVGVMIVMQFTVFGGRFFDSTRPLFLIVLLGFALFPLSALWRARSAAAPARRPAIRAVPACWIAARMGDEPRAAAVPPSYYAGLEFEDGSRGEYLVDGSLVTQLRGGEIGAALVSDGVLLDFRRAP